MPEEFVKQHIVPKRYLDRFTFEKDGKPVIGVRLTTKDKPKFFTSPTEKVGYIKNFYDVTDRDDPKYWEHYFAREFDALCGNKLQNIICRITLSGKEYKLNTNEIDVLSKLVVAQAFRVPESMNYINKFYKEKLAPLKKWYVSTFPKNDQQTVKSFVSGIQYSKQQRKEIYMNTIFNPNSFEQKCNTLKERVWIVLYNSISYKIPFFTSDDPVLIESLSDDRTGAFNNGFANITTIIYFPLTPQIAILNYPKEMFMDIDEEVNGGKLSLCDEEYIISKNNRMIERAFKHVFIPQPLFDEYKREQDH